MNKKIEFGSIQAISSGLGETFDICFSHSKEVKKEIELFIKSYERKIGKSDENALKNIKIHITDSLRIYESCYDNTNHLDEIIDLIKSSNDIGKGIIQMKDQYMTQRKENRLKKEKIEDENIEMFLSMKRLKVNNDDEQSVSDSTKNNNNIEILEENSNVSSSLPSDETLLEDTTATSTSLDNTPNIPSQELDSTEKESTNESDGTPLNL